MQHCDPQKLRRTGIHPRKNVTRPNRILLIVKTVGVFRSHSSVRIEFLRITGRLRLISGVLQQTSEARRFSDAGPDSRTPRQRERRIEGKIARSVVRKTRIRENYDPRISLHPLRHFEIFGSTISLTSRNGCSNARPSSTREANQGVRNILTYFWEDHAFGVKHRHVQTPRSSPEAI